MKNQNKIHDQLTYLAAWNRRKRVLLIVLTFSVILLLFSFLRILTEPSFQFFQPSSAANIAWAYFGMGIALALIIIIFIQLLREISASLKIVDGLKMQWEHY